jgi:hypothetical protein
MKQRITYLLPKGNRVEAEDISTSSDSLTFSKADQAAEEWRMTLGWHELPLEVSMEF